MVSSIKKFEDFVKEGIVRLQSPDKLRAKFLIGEAQKDYTFLKEIVKMIGINDKNANSLIKMSYDSLMELTRATMICDGLYCSGMGAHEAEVSYLREAGFCEEDVLFANQLRYFRNRILYYGKILEKDYAEKVFHFLRNVYDRLKKIVDDKLEEVKK